jgi:hypothetical protein
MAARFAVERFWPPATLGALSTVAAGFAINFLTDGKTWWWGTVVGLAVIGLVGAAVWSNRISGAGAAGDVTPPPPPAPHGAQRSQIGDDAVISMRADHGSTAAWQIGTVNMGAQPDDERPDTR